MTDLSPKRVDRSVAARLAGALPVVTLVSGPAGCGKTELARDLARQAGFRHAELPVAARMAGAGAFLAAVSTAAGAALPGADVPALAADDLRFGHVWLERLMAAAVAGGPFCLQLDDLHELGQGSAAEQLLAVAARAAPAGFHLLVTTRRPPGPPWARLLAEGMAVLVGVDDL
ncbi:AAA family ATPase, partial [Amaricoccus sp.]|uniref:AAA family ATPase n=1 Tax=Amaricoccus sp. TaxID=1872485 RepID=UPI0026028857